MSGKLLSKTIEQTQFWVDDSIPTPVVNVASIAQRSPFRYPGGKTWLVPRIRQWLASQYLKPSRFVEPFAGGAIAGLTVAFDGLAKKVILVEKDEQVAAVWDTIINSKDGADWLTHRIGNFELTPESCRTLLTQRTRSKKEKAFQTIVRNRISRGGILAPGAGVLKQGENGKGLLSRWYPVTLGRRITEIGRVRQRLKFIQGDRFEVMRRYLADSNAAFFIDPPYTASAKRAGSRLYKFYHVDHEELFRLASKIQGDFLMTYDAAEEVRSLAAKFSFETREVAMSNTHHAMMTELLVGRDLSWLK